MLSRITYAMVTKNLDILYIFIFGVAFNSLVIDEIIKAIMALPIFLIIPYRFGDSMLIICKKLFGSLFDFEFNFDLMSALILLYGFGMVQIVLVALLLSYFSIFTMSNYLILIFILITVAIAIDVVSNGNNKTPKNPIPLKTSLKKYSIFLLLIVLSMFPICFLMLFTQFPLPLGGIDTFVHLSSIQQIAEDNYINQSWMNTYPPTVQILFSIASVLFKVSPLSLFWATPFLLYPLYAIGMYIFSFELSKNKLLSVIAAVIGVYSTGYPQWTFVANLYYAIPKNLIYLSFPFLLFLATKNFQIIDNFRKDTNNISLCLTNSFLVFSILSLSLSQAIHRLPYIFIVTAVVLSLLFIVKRFPTHFLLFIDGIFLFSIILLFFSVSAGELPYGRIFFGTFVTALYFPLSLLRKKVQPMNFLVFSIVSFISFFFHLVMGLLLILIVFLYLFGQICARSSLKIVPSLIAIFASVLIIFQVGDVISFTWVNDFLSPIISSISAEGLFAFDFSTKFEMLSNSYSIVTLVLAVVGLVAISIVDKNRFIHVVPIFPVLIFLYFLPIPDIFRMITYMTPFVSFLAAYILTLPQKLKINYAWIASFRKIKSFGYAVAVIALLTPNIILPHWNTYQTIDNWSKSSSIISILSHNDIQAAMWIKENTPKDVIILSQIEASVIFSSLSNREEAFNMLGLTGITDRIREIFETANASKAYNIILGIREEVLRYDKTRTLSGSRFLEGDRSVIIVADGRTARMVKTSSSGPCVTVPFELFNGFSKFYDDAYFMPLSEVDGEIYIFGVKIKDSFAGYQLQITGISDCDSTTGWATAPDVIQIFLEERDKIQGLASIKSNAIKLVAASWIDVNFKTDSGQDWSSKNFLQLYIEVADISSFAKFYFVVDDGAENGYDLDILDELRSGEWSRVIIPLSYMKPRGAAPSLSSIRRISFSGQLTTSPTNADFWIDDIAVGQIVRVEQ